MPKIPSQRQRELPQLVPGVRVSPEAMTQEARAMVGFGQAMTEVSKLGFAFAAKLKEARELTEYNNTVTDTDALYNGLEESLAKDPDYTTYDKQFEETTKAAAKLRDRFTEPEAKAKWESYFKKTTEVRRHIVAGLKRVREIKKMEGDLEANLTAAERSGDLNRAILLLESGKMADVIDPKQAEIRKAKIEQNIDFYKAQSLIQQDPGMAIDIILDTKLLPNLGDKRFPLAKTAEIAANRQKTLAEKAQKEIQEKTTNSFFPRIDDLKNPLTYLEVEQAVLTGRLSFEDGKWYRKILGLDEIDIKDNPATAIMLNDGINQQVSDNATLRTSVLKARGLKEIGKVTSDKLLNKINQKIVAEDNKWKTKASSYLKSQIMPSRGLLVGESSDEAVDLYNAELALESAMEEAKKEGKPLHGKDILKKAMEISPLYQKTVYERIELLRKQSGQGKKPEEKGFLEKIFGKKVIRTGTQNGRKVIEYSDGSVEYAD